MSRITETIGKWGVTSSDAQTRTSTPRPGDVIRFGKNREYPKEDAEFGIIDSVNGNRISFCVHPMQNGIHLFEDGKVSISGGPFGSCSKTEIVPTHELQNVLFWNWGDNAPGGGMDVTFTLARPVFQIVE